MNQHFALTRFLPSLVGLISGVAASGATLSYYRGNPFDVILLGSALYALGFLIGSTLLAGIFWLIGWITVGSLGRQGFQVILVLCAAASQLIIAALSTHDLYQLGVFSDFFSKPATYPRLMILALPYVMTVSSLVALLNSESEKERNTRTATLQAVESEYEAEKSRSRTTALLPIVICVIVGSVLGWLLPLQPEASAFSTVLYAAVGIPIGMTVHRYLPAQRKLRRLESTKERLRW